MCLKVRVRVLQIIFLLMEFCNVLTFVYKMQCIEYFYLVTVCQCVYLSLNLKVDYFDRHRLVNPIHLRVTLYKMWFVLTWFY